MGTKSSLSLVVKFHGSFNFVEIAFIRFVFKQCFHTLTYSQFSTLIVHFYFSSTLSLCTFLKKSTKNGAAVYGIRCFLCSQIASALAAAIFFSRFTPRRSPLVAMLGVARTRCAQTSCHLFPSIARLLAVPPNAALPPLAGNYLLQYRRVE